MKEAFKIAEAWVRELGKRHESTITVNLPVQPLYQVIELRTWRKGVDLASCAIGRSRFMLWWEGWRIPLNTKYARIREEAESGVYIKLSYCSVMNFLLPIHLKRSWSLRRNQELVDVLPLSLPTRIRTLIKPLSKLTRYLVLGMFSFLLNWILLRKNMCQETDVPP